MRTVLAVAAAFLIAAYAPVPNHNKDTNDRQLSDVSGPQHGG